MSASKQSDPSFEQLNETGRRNVDDRRKDSDEAGEERREVQRRRQIDPTTCERDYTEDEIEFMQALDVYKRASGRMFPTCSEILEVLIGMGYRRVMTSDGQPIDDYDRCISSAEPFQMTEQDSDEAEEEFEADEEN